MQWTRARACVIWMAVISQHTISSSYKRPVVCVRVCCWRCATDAAWSLPFTPPSPSLSCCSSNCLNNHCQKTTSSFSPTPWPLSSLTLGSPLGLRYRDIAIRTAVIIDMDFLLRYNPYCPQWHLSTMTPVYTHTSLHRHCLITAACRSVIKHASTAGRYRGSIQ